MPNRFYLHVSKELHLRTCLSGIDYKQRQKTKIAPRG